MTPALSRSTARCLALLGALLVLVTAAVVGPSALSRAAVSARSQVTAAVAAPAAPAAAVAPAVAAMSDVAPADAAHPYSDPIWFPLRSPARVGCVYNNCPGPYHGYWAIDFGGNLNDPIYAAGGGIFHIGAIDNTCPASGNTSGTWVWIDHGPAGITEYAHLNTVLAKEGQIVTPATEIGTMGHNGNTAPCHPNYLHMEWRANGTTQLDGTRQPIPTMYACEGSTKVSFPTALGKSAWNSFVNNATTTPTLDNACMPSTTWGTPNRPTVNLNRGSKSAVVIPSARPEDAVAWMDRVELYSTTYRKYLIVGYYQHYPTTAYTTATGLLDGRTYRITVAFHNAAGWSAWAPTELVIPASAPTTPVPRSLTAGSNWILYSWNRSTSSGATTATYEVARRCVLSGTWHSWVYNLVPGTNTSYEWHPALGHTECEITVRAHNNVGWSPWATRHFATTS